MSQSPVVQCDSTRRNRLDLVATTVGETIRSAGGWICDHALAGWEVTVFVTEHCDSRPLEILGAEVVEIDRDRLGRSVGERTAEAVLLAGDRSVVPGRRIERVDHRPTVAARAFKACALAAANLSSTVHPIESFRLATAAESSLSVGSNIVDLPVAQRN